MSSGPPQQPVAGSASEQQPETPQPDMRARLSAAVLDGAVQAAFRQLVPPGLRAAVQVLAEWDARWFADLDRPSYFADAGAARSRGDRAFEAACTGAAQARADGMLPPLASALRRHAWTLGPLRLAGGRWAAALVRLEGRDSATNLYTRVAQVALVDPRHDPDADGDAAVAVAAQGERALRRLEHALGRTGLTFGAGDVRPGGAAWARAAWRRTPWAAPPRQADANDGSDGPRYYALARAVFARLAALWEAQGGDGHLTARDEPPYDEAALWAAPLPGPFNHAATRWEMAGHHASVAVRDAHEHQDEARAAAAAQPAPATPAFSSFMFAPLVNPLTVRHPPPPSVETEEETTTDTTNTSSEEAAAAVATAAVTATPQPPPLPPHGGTGHPAPAPTVEEETSEEETTTTNTDFSTMSELEAEAEAQARARAAEALTTIRYPLLSPIHSGGRGRKRGRAEDGEDVASFIHDNGPKRVRASDAAAPPNSYPVYPDRPLDPWDWRCVRWKIEDPAEARRLAMHAAHWREAAAAAAAAVAGHYGYGYGHGDYGHGSDHGATAGVREESGPGPNEGGAEQGRSSTNDGEPGPRQRPPPAPQAGPSRFAYTDAEGNPRMDSEAMGGYVLRLMGAK